jgi:hypothetical protein
MTASSSVSLRGIYCQYLSAAGYYRSKTGRMRGVGIQGRAYCAGRAGGRMLVNGVVVEEVVVGGRRSGGIVELAHFSCH